MKTSAKVSLAFALLGILGIGILARNVNAKEPQSYIAIHHQTGTQIAEASDGDGETNDGTTEAAKLQSLAKITPQQAQQAAENNVGGKASSVKLENENGSLIYAVMIGTKEVIVDAGNSKVLDVQNGNQDEKTESSMPKSSIQVPNGGDGDGETNDDGGK